MSARRTKPLLPRKVFVVRVLRSLLLALGIIAASLGLGIVGYHYCAGLSWVDALLNASMILTGMGPVDPMTTDAAKLFASGYALLSGAIYPVLTAVVLYPFVHRLLHRLHLDALDAMDDGKS